MQKNHLSFTIGNAIRTGFGIFQDNLALMVSIFTTLIGAMILGVLAFVVAAFFGEYATVVVCCILVILGAWLFVGTADVLLAVSRGVSRLSLKEVVVYSPKKFILAVVVLALLSAPSFLITYVCSNFLDNSLLLSALLLVYACISAQCQFALYIAIEKQTWPWFAIIESWKLTRGHRLGVIGLIVAYEIVSILGVVFVVLYGVVPFMALTTLSLVSAYRLLQSARTRNENQTVQYRSEWCTMKTIDDYIDFLTTLSGKKMSTLEYIQQVCNEYRTKRIEKTNLATDGDMLLLQWNSQNGADEIIITRQIVQDENGTLEFDDCAMQVHMTLCFTNSGEVLRAGNIWIENPNVIGERLESVKKLHPLAPLLTQAPSEVFVSQSPAG